MTTSVPFRVMVDGPRLILQIPAGQIVVEAAEELREQELAAVIAAADRAPRPVILRVIRDG